MRLGLWKLGITVVFLSTAGAGEKSAVKPNAAPGAPKNFDRLLQDEKIKDHEVPENLRKIQSPGYQDKSEHRINAKHKAQESRKTSHTLAFGKSEKPKGKYKPTWPSLETRPLPRWYDDAKIGIFIHWGIFSVPSYVARGTDGYAEWFWKYLAMTQTGREHHGSYHRKEAVESVQRFMKEQYPPGFKYTDFAPMFRAEFFKPEEWAELFKASGARYVVLTSKHHEGFTLWGSKKSWNWNAVDNGPHRDLVGDLAKAIRKNTKIKFGLYHSLYEWFNPLYLDDKKNNFTTQVFVKDKLMPELHEMVVKYKPEVVWSDGHWEAPCNYWKCKEFMAWLFNESPVKNTVVTNDRWGSDKVSCKHGSFLTCDDRYNPGKLQRKKWENCMTLDRESWGYRRNAGLKEYLDMEELTTVLAQTISNGGNLLINIGPTAEGVIPPILEERLRQLGSWLQVNGEGIYRTRVWRYQKDPLNKNVYYTKKTVKSGVLVLTNIYAIVVDWPKGDRLTLKAPEPTTATTVTWLGYSKPIKWSKGHKGELVLNLPRVSMRELPCQWAWVFRMTKLANAVDS